MIEAVNWKAGMTETADGKLIRVLEASHHKPGAEILSCVWNCVMSVLVQHLIQVTVQKKIWTSDIETSLQLNTCTKWIIAYFMNTETYDQYEIPAVNVEQELFLYILENLR